MFGAIPSKFKRASSCESMEVVAHPPSKRKKARKRVHAVSHFFFEKVKTLLCRTRNAIKVFPDAAKATGVSLNVLDDLDAFADVRSLDDVCGLLGGPKSLLSKLFLSIIDDGEKAELEVYACLPRSKLFLWNFFWSFNQRNFCSFAL